MNGRVVITTGASKGIGRGIAIGLATAGASVVVHYKTDAEGADETVRQIHNVGGTGLAIAADLGRSSEARHLIAQTLSRLGRIDLLVNNAGRTRFGPPDHVTDEDFDDVVDTNLRGTLFTSVAAAQAMRAEGGGAIVNISSCAATLMIHDHPVYTMSKGGLEALTRQLALEFAPLVRVNAIAPAPTSNERNRQYDPDYDEHWGRVIPMGRVGYPEDLVGPVIFLATDASRFLTGEVLHVDGGWTLAGCTPSLEAYDYSGERERG